MLLFHCYQFHWPFAMPCSWLNTNYLLYGENVVQMVRRPTETSLWKCSLACLWFCVSCCTYDSHVRNLQANGFCFCHFVNKFVLRFSQNFPSVYWNWVFRRLCDFSLHFISLLYLNTCFVMLMQVM